MKKIIKATNWSSNVAPYGEEIHFDKSKLKDFYGLRGIKVINIDAKHDPYVMYKKKIVNYYDVEDALWEEYKDICGETGKTPNESDFTSNFVPKNRATVIELIDSARPVAEITDDLSDWYTASIIASRTVKAATNSCNIPSNPIKADPIEASDDEYEPYDEGFGTDSNGEYITESTVEELCRIAQETLDASDLEKIFDYPEIDPETWKENYHNTGFAWGAWLEYDIFADANNYHLNLTDCYKDSWDGTFPDLSMHQDVYKALLSFTIHVKNDDVKNIDMSADVQEHGRYDEYDSKRFFDVFDKDKIAEKVAKYFEPVIREIHVVVSNI